MKILLLADEESKALWDFYTPDKLDGIDLIISCGDLSPNYLQFLVTFGNCPLLYVHGNHDAGYDRNPPDGCICIDDKVYNFKGLRILGLGGSMRYKPGPYMYTEDEMKKRIRRMKRAIRHTNGFDLLVTHAPAKGYGDMDDIPHRGFECFNTLMEEYEPVYMVHGHVHKTYSAGFLRQREHACGTRIINCYETYLLEIAEADHPQFGKTGSKLYDIQTMHEWKKKRKYLV